MPRFPNWLAPYWVAPGLVLCRSVVFAGFSAGSLVDRITDSGCTVVLTADGSTRGGKRIDLKKIVDDALPKCPTIKSVVVFGFIPRSARRRDAIVVAQCSGYGFSMHACRGNGCRISHSVHLRIDRKAQCIPAAIMVFINYTLPHCVSI